MKFRTDRLTQKVHPITEKVGKHYSSLKGHAKGMAHRTRSSRIGSSMVGQKPKSKELADMISIRDPQEAQDSQSALIRKYKEAQTDEERLHIIRAADLAGKRARMQMKRKDISPSEKREMRSVAWVYEATVKTLREDYNAKRGKYVPLKKNLMGKGYAYRESVWYPVKEDAITKTDRYREEGAAANIREGVSKKWGHGYYVDIYDKKG